MKKKLKMMKTGELWVYKDNSRPVVLRIKDLKRDIKRNWWNIKIWIYIH